MNKNRLGIFAGVVRLGSSRLSLWVFLNRNHSHYARPADYAMFLVFFVRRYCCFKSVICMLLGVFLLVILPEWLSGGDQLVAS